ncbi:MAG: hypothetical protein ABSF69_18925 [Polyangiaceae bacterium]
MPPSLLRVGPVPTEASLSGPPVGVGPEGPPASELALEKLDGLDDVDAPDPLELAAAAALPVDPLELAGVELVVELAALVALGEALGAPPAGASGVLPHRASSMASRASAQTFRRIGGSGLRAMVMREKRSPIILG